jgi:hypothetical protein
MSTLMKTAKLNATPQWEEYLQMVSNTVGLQTYRVMMLYYKASLLVHWFACFFHHVAILGGETDTWVDHEVRISGLPILVL